MNVSTSRTTRSGRSQCTSWPVSGLHLQGGIGNRCGKPLVPNNKDCGLLDYERNCIYAAHGMRFRNAKWAAYAGIVA